MKFFKKKIITNNSLLDKVGNRIYFGPFTGLKIPKEVSSIISTKEILGLYESCLHTKFEYLVNENIRNILFVGGNNGYYAAGLTYILNPDSIKIYETEEYFHNIIESWFQKNNLSNFSIQGKATKEVFQKIEANINLVFMDCEGYEIELLNPSQFTWQERSTVIVEIHPFYIDNLLSIISDRFRITHNIQIIYDDFNEDYKIDKILNGLELDIQYPKHPNHRWIIENDKKVYTSGLFMVLTPK